MFKLTLMILVAASAASAQQNVTVAATGNAPLDYKVCVDSDCQVTSSITLAAGYFSAKSFVALSQLNAKLDQQNNLLNTLVQKSSDTNDLVAKQIRDFNQDLRDTINAKFDSLPAELTGSAPIAQLRKDLMNYVDQKLKTQQPTPPPPVPQPAK